MEQNSIGCVYLVGAGCGSAQLITVLGLRLLRSCDAVVYDDLIDPALLNEAERAERYPVGKRCGGHSVPQEETNALLVQLAKEGKTVVRLKGGDPFVFGRGGEEILTLQEAGIPYEEVPGISSAIAIPAAAGIPVTHREMSRSFHVITGHTNALDDTLPESIETLAALDGTLIFLMGLSGLEKIADRLMAAGKSPQTPAAVISGGNSPHKATVRGTLADIAAKTRQQQVKAPAVIVVGQTAALHMEGTVKHPLEDVRIGLCGTSVFVSKLERGFQALGAKTRRMLSARIRRLPMPYDAKQLCDREAKWIVLTSSNGVRCFFEWLSEAEIDLRLLHHCKFAVIGKATGETLKSYGILADLCPQRATGEDLARLLCDTVEREETVLLLRSKRSDDTIPQILKEHDIRFSDLALYDTEYQSNEITDPMDYLVFGSACGVKAYFDHYPSVSPETTCVCIGPVSATAFRKCCPEPFLTAEEISADGIIRSVTEDRKQRQA